MKFINLTNNTINELESGITIEPSGSVAYASRNSKQVDTIDNIPIYSEVPGNINLPEPKDGITYIVSALAHKSVPTNRTDIVYPGNLERDCNNNIIGCKGFKR